MVCSKCEKKLDKVITPDVWKSGSRNTTGGKDGGRKLGVNMLLEKKKFAFTPYGDKCKKCNKKIQDKFHYCTLCAYENGRCGMCGIKIVDVTMQKQRNI
jgi:hypothetical protein